MDMSEVDLDSELTMWASLQGGQFDAASATAARLLITSVDPGQRGRVEAALGIMLQRVGLMADAREQFTRAIALVTGSPGDDATFLAVSSLSNVLGGDLPGAEAQAKRAIEVGEQSGTWFAVRQARTTMAAVHLGHGHPQLALAEARRATSMATQGEAQAEYRSTAHVLVGMALAELDRLPDAISAIETGIRIAHEEGDTGQLSWYLASKALIHLLDGNWPAAITDCQESLRVADSTGALAARPLAWGIWALIEGARGNTSQARHLIDLARSNRMGPYGGLGEEWVAMAQAVASQDPQERYDCLCEAWFRLRGVPFLLAWRLLAPQVVQLAVVMKDDAVARAVTATAVDGAERAGGIASATAAARLCEGICTSDAELTDSGYQALKTAGRPLSLALGAVDAANQWLQIGDGRRAGELLRESTEIFHSLRATRWTAFTARMLAVANNLPTEPLPNPAPERWDVLTRSEREVARHAAKGLTNPEIARVLSLSARTVQTHMSHIYAKLGVSSRVQVATHLSGRDLS